MLKAVKKVGSALSLGWRRALAATNMWPGVGLTIYTITLFIQGYFTQKPIPCPSWSGKVTCDVLIGFYYFFSSGIIVNIESAAWVGWMAFMFRGIIKELLFDKEIVVRSPLMLASAPILFIEKQAIWERANRRLKVDFTYAGINALADLTTKKIHGAVVSDIALTNFLRKSTVDNAKKADSGEGIENSQFFIVPFVQIRDNIRFIVRRTEGTLEYNDINALRSKIIGYMDDTVHTHFLKSYMQDDFVKSRITSPIQGIGQLLTREIDALVLWEPHYITFDKEKYPGLALLPPGDSSEYVWYLCLVMDATNLDSHKKMYEILFTSIERSCQACQASGGSKVEVATASDFYSRMNGEFLGLAETDFTECVNESSNFRFGISNNRLNFERRMMTLTGEANADFGGVAGVTLVQNMLWSKLMPQLVN